MTTHSGLVVRSRLFEMLDAGVLGAVTMVAAPPGSGKTTLVRSWLASRPAPTATAWVDVQRDETDPAHFWGQVLDAVRESGVVEADSVLATLVPTPHAEPGELVRHLVAGLGGLAQPLLLVLDDVQHLRAPELLDGLETLLTASPPTLRTMLLSRRDPKVGLHRLRLSGQLTEVRSAHLEFTESETAELLAGAGVDVGADDVTSLHERTEGWATGLRLAAMSLAQHDAPERFVAEFAGSERTVADYLLGEVLQRQPAEVTDLLLRTCVLDQVNGELADLLTGRTDGARLLHDLAEANALVVPVDVARRWFRYHHLLLDLLRLELRRELPGEIEELHSRAARWFAAQGRVVEAIRHARQAKDWELACELLGEHSVGLVLDGEEATLSSLLEGIPDAMARSDAEVATMLAADRLSHGLWAEGDDLLASARATIAEVPEVRRARAEMGLAACQLFRDRQIGGAGEYVDEASTVLARLGAAGPRGADLEGLARVNLGVAQAWTLRLQAAQQNLERALALGRTIGRPYVEIGGLTALGNVAILTGRAEEGEQLLRAAVDVAERVGWTTHHLLGPACMGLAAALVDRGMLAECEEWVDRAEPILARAPEPAASIGLQHTRGLLAMCRGRYDEALAAFREGERFADTLHTPHVLGILERPWQLRARLCLGETDAVRAELVDPPPIAVWCNLVARFHLATDDPEAALSALAPVHGGEAEAFHVNFEIEAWILDALARRAMGDAAGAERSLETALALSEPGGRVALFLTIPGVADLLGDHPTHRTAHGAHLQVLRDALGGAEPEAVLQPTDALREPLKERELAVLRFLSTNLTAAEIGNELFLSVHTVKTHMRKLYAKLEVHTRAEAVQQGRALGLLAPARRSH